MLHCQFGYLEEGSALTSCMTVSELQWLINFRLA